MLLTGQGLCDAREVSCFILTAARIYLAEPALYNHDGFIAGRFNTSDTEALLLAALSIQIEYGDHNPNRHTAGWLRNIIQDYIPPPLFRLQKPKVWEQDLIETHQKMVGFVSSLRAHALAGLSVATITRCGSSVCLQTEMMCKQNYLRVCQKFTAYGYSLFHCKQTFLKGVPKNVYVGVNRAGADVFRTDDKSIVQEYAPGSHPMPALLNTISFCLLVDDHSNANLCCHNVLRRYPLSKLQSFSADSTHLSLKIGEGKDAKAHRFITGAGSEIVRVLKDVSRALPGVAAPRAGPGGVRHLHCLMCEILRAVASS